MKKLNVFLLTILTILLCISCEIGLGSAVDTEPPSLEIVNPPVDTIVRGSFSVSGNWKDDGTVSEVSVKLTRTDEKGSAVTVKAEVTSEDGGKGKWSAPLNPVEDGILDGSYEALVEITDAAGHKTTQSRTFTIDNTAPVIVLQRPGTKITETPDAFFIRNIQLQPVDTVLLTVLKAAGARDHAPAVFLQGCRSMQSQPAGSSGHPDCFLSAHASSKILKKAPEEILGSPLYQTF